MMGYCMGYAVKYLRSRQAGSWGSGDNAAARGTRHLQELRRLEAAAKCNQWG